MIDGPLEKMPGTRGISPEELIQKIKLKGREICFPAFCFTYLPKG